MKRSISYCFLLLLGIFLFSISHKGQAQSFPNYREYTIEDGLPSSNIYRVIQDKAGFIWVATDQGVARFNGYSFQHFTAKDGLPSDDVWKLSEDKEGRIWLSTFNEIGYLFNDKYHSLPVQKDIKTNGILTHYIFQQDSIERHYVNAILGKSFLGIENDSIFEIERKFKQKAEFVTKTLFHILGIDNEGKEWYLFIGGRKKVYCSLSSRNNKGFLEVLHKISREKYIPYNEFQIHFFSKHDLLIISIGDETYSFDFEKVEILKTFKNLELGASFKTFRLNDDELIIKGTRTYLYNVKTKKIRAFKFQLGKSITSIQEDREGNIWTSSQDGLKYFSKESAFVSRLKEVHQKSGDNFLSTYNSRFAHF